MKDERKDERELQKVCGSEVFTQLALQNDQALFCIYCMHLYMRYFVSATHLNNGSQSALLVNELSGKTHLPCIGRDQSSSPRHILAPTKYKTKLHNFSLVIFVWLWPPWVACVGLCSWCNLQWSSDWHARATKAVRSTEYNASSSAKSGISVLIWLNGLYMLHM